MSASRDKSQKFTFVYSNLHKINKDGGKSGDSGSELGFSGIVLKSEERRVGARVNSYVPAELIGKRVARPDAASAPRASAPKKDAIASLKQNLKSLNDLHARLRFMLQELEELVKE